VDWAEAQVIQAEEQQTVQVFVMHLSPHLRHDLPALKVI
jgi:hypothetical protein